MRCGGRDIVNSTDYSECFDENASGGTGFLDALLMDNKAWITGRLYPLLTTVNLLTRARHRRVLECTVMALDEGAGVLKSAAAEHESQTQHD